MAAGMSSEADAEGGVRHYLVELGRTDSPTSRGAMMRDNASATHTFVANLRQKAAERHLEGGIANVVERPSMRFVSVDCTPPVADLIGSMPEVRDVIATDRLPPVHLVSDV